MGKKNNIDFDTVVKNKKLPILTLDGRWHELFPDDAKTARVKELEQEVNNLLKKQGKMVNDIKDMKKLKNSLIKDIVVNMDIGTDIIGKAKEKKLDQNKQYIKELNDKIDQAMDELADIPYQIKAVNEVLMAESMKICYDLLGENKQAIAEIADWIGNVREELKKKILQKQDMEIKNNLIYTYMHDILGAELMEAFDQEHKIASEKK
jgi:Mg2+ and Co2+ transporter CorA